MVGKKAVAKKKAEQAKKKANAPAKKPKQVFEVSRDDELDSDLELEPSTSGGENSAIVYIGRIPHGFYEDQLKGFFSQFGDVKRWRVSRSKKNARSKGYAFVEFAHADVAVIAADAMNGYLMFKQALKCHVMKKADVHPQLFNERNKQMKKMPWRKLEAERHNKDRTVQEAKLRTQRAIRRDRQRQERLKKAGIDYEYEPLSAQLPAKAVHKKFDGSDE